MDVDEDPSTLVTHSLRTERLQVRTWWSKLGRGWQATVLGLFVVFTLVLVL